MVKLTEKVNRFISSKECKHNPWTHLPKDHDCDMCREAKSNCAECRSKTFGALPRPLTFAESITADHQIRNEDDAGCGSDRVAMIDLDRWSRWLQGDAFKGNLASESQKIFKRFLRPLIQARACLHWQLQRNA